MDSRVASDGETVPVSLAEARAELERLLSDPDFRSPERNRRFLRFVSEEFFEGRGEALKAYTIAVDAFGRPASFDPGTDSIVRIEAVRLRNALSQYYEAHPDACIRIDLPKGRYVPVFSRFCPIAAQYSSKLIELPMVRGLLGRTVSEGKDEADRPSKRRWAIVTVTIVVTCLLLGGSLLLLRLLAPPPVFSGKPTVAIAMQAPAGDRKAEMVRDAIMVSLSQFQTLRAAWNADDGSTAADVTAAIGRPKADERSSAYRVTLKYAGDEGGGAIWWQVVDPATGELLRSGIERVADNVRLDVSPEQQLAMQVAARLAGRHGAINELEMAREYASPSLGNGCVVRAMARIGSPDLGDLTDARECLSRTLAIAPNNADANATMSLVLTRDAPEQALDFANDAVMLAPSSDRAKMAQSVALYHSGKVDAAITAGYRALSLNPANGAIAAKLGLMVYLSGLWQQGVDLATRSGRFDGYSYRDAALTLALEAYRAGSYDAALRRAREMSDTEPLGALLVAAILGQQGDADAGRAAIAAIRSTRPDAEATLRSDLAARHFPPVLVEAIETGLGKAAASVR